MISGLLDKSFDNEQDDNSKSTAITSLFAAPTIP
ncbi:hypothetical protein SAMN05192588_2748 [Nonlabens sp. Hel1_33_55]|nr:hypothetical protein SAMN05192588_2748 [Nonlabens sp. Hel1_33_55]